MTREPPGRTLSFCTARGIAPETIGPAAFDAFRTALEEESLTGMPGTIYRRTCTTWNKAAGSIPGWPSFQPAVPADSRRYALDWAAFPESFQADANAFLHRLGNQDPFADDYAVSVKPST